MKINHFYLKSISDQINKKLPCRINKIRKGFKSELLLELYNKELKKTLVIDVNPDFSAFHLAEKGQFMSFNINAFTGFLRKFFNRKILAQIDVLHNERIVYLAFENAPLLVAHIFPRGGNIFAVDPETGKILSSLLKASDKNYFELEAKLIEGSRKAPKMENEELPPMSEIAEKYYDKLKNHLSSVLERKRSRELKREISSLKRKVANIEKDYNNCQKAESFSLFGNILLSYHANDKRKGLSNIESFDFEGNKIEIPLVEKLSVQENAERYFTRSKKMKKALPILSKRLNEEKDLLEELKQEKESKEVLSLEELKSFFEKKKKSKDIVKLERELLYFENEKNVRIYVGRNSDENDLIYKLARGRDYWFHNRDYPGSHVLIRVERNERPDESSIADAALLAILYSKSRKNGEGYVMMSRRKFLSRTPGMPAGKVNVSRFKSILVRVDEKRAKALKKVKQR